MTIVTEIRRYRSSRISCSPFWKSIKLLSLLAVLTLDTVSQPEHIKRTTSTTISEFCHKILMKARSLLDCHSCGMAFLAFHYISEDESVFNAGSDVDILLKQCISVREAVDPSEQIKVYLR